VIHVQFIITVICDCFVVYVRQHEESSVTFAEIALYWIWKQENCSRFSEILL